MMFESPRSVLQTLPLTRADATIFRWWAGFGMPALVVLGCMAASRLYNAHEGWRIPSTYSLEASAVVVVAMLGWITCLPILRSRTRSDDGRMHFTLVWSVIALWAGVAVASAIGLRLDALSQPVLLPLGVLGVSLSVASCIRAEWRRGRAGSSMEASAVGLGLPPA
jgi:hypothetical protein